MRELADYLKRITGQALAIRAAVGMILVFKHQRAIALNAIREIQVSACHEHQIALQRAVLLDRSRAVDLGVKTIVCPQQFERGAGGEQLGCGTWHEELWRIQFVNHIPRFRGDELDAEAGVSELRPVHDFLETLLEGGAGLRKGCAAAIGNNSAKETEGDHPNGMSGAHAIPPSDTLACLISLDCGHLLPCGMPRAPVAAADGDFLNTIPLHGVAKAWSFWHPNSALFCNFNRRFDNIFAPIALARRNISG